MLLTGVTWNILAQRYWRGTGNKPRKETYNDIPSNSVYAWPNRCKRIIQKLNETKSDIICLQEVELKTAKDDFAPLFEDYEFAMHVNFKKRTSPIGNMILWNKNKLSLVKNKDNSAGVHCLLLVNGSTRMLWIGNVHLKAGVLSCEQTRLNQIKSTIKIINWLPTATCIVGDYNDELKEDGKLYKILQSNGFHAASIEKAPISCFHRDKQGVGKYWSFDHVYAKKCNFNYITKDLTRQIPDEDNPSDHLMLEFVIRFSV